MLLNDILIVSKIKKGDIRAFETLFRSYYEPLCLYSTGFVREMEDAEEIVQDLFYKIWKDRENLQITFSIKAYLYGAVRNNSLQYLEHLQIKQNYRDQEMKKLDKTNALSPEEQLEYKELQEHLNESLNQLPERQRKIFTMSRFEGKKYIEIAKELSLSVKTIEAEMTKALQALKKEMAHYK